MIIKLRRKGSKLNLHIKDNKVVKIRGSKFYKWQFESFGIHNSILTKGYISHRIRPEFIEQSKGALCVPKEWLYDVEYNGVEGLAKFLSEMDRWDKVRVTK